jgi:hypothetical protein
MAVVGLGTLIVCLFILSDRGVVLNIKDFFLFFGMCEHRKLQVAAFCWDGSPHMLNWMTSRNDLERAKRGLGHAKPAFELNSGPLDPRSREAPPPLCRWI